MSEPFFDRQIVAQRVELVGPGSIDAVAPQEGFGLSIGRGDGGFELRDDAAAAHDVAANRSARQAGPRGLAERSTLRRRGCAEGLTMSEFMFRNLSVKVFAEFADDAPVCECCSYVFVCADCSECTDGATAPPDCGASAPTGPRRRPTAASAPTG